MKRFFNICMRVLRYEPMIDKKVLKCNFHEKDTDLAANNTC